jgi:hypothetical protein
MRALYCTGILLQQYSSVHVQYLASGYYFPFERGAVSLRWKVV